MKNDGVENPKGAKGYSPLSLSALNILLSLADEERHGYGVMQEVERRSGGKTKLGPGTLYRSIGQMQERGLIEESGERPDPDLDDQRRRYYRITGQGREVASAEIDRLEELVEAAREKRLWGGTGGPEAFPEGA